MSKIPPLVRKGRAILWTSAHDQHIGRELTDAELAAIWGCDPHVVGRRRRSIARPFMMKRVKYQPGD